MVYDCEGGRGQRKVAVEKKMGDLDRAQRKCFLIVWRLGALLERDRERESGKGVTLVWAWCGWVPVFRGPIGVAMILQQEANSDKSAVKLFVLEANQRPLPAFYRHTRQEKKVLLVLPWYAVLLADIFYTGGPGARAVCVSPVRKASVRQTTQFTVAF